MSPLSEISKLVIDPKVHHSVTETPLSKGCKPHRVGVFLDQFKG